MRFAVIANVQSNAVALEAVLADIDQLERKVDTVLSAGDIVGIGPQPNEVIDMLREREVESVMGNYDEAIATGRKESGSDFPTEEGHRLDSEALAWTRGALTEANLEFVRELPRDLRLSPGGMGTAVAKNRGDERTAEYKRTFFLRAMFGGMFRMPVTGSKRVLIVHGSPRASNEFIREDTANSILAGVSRETQADVLITGHSGTSFRRDAHGITFIGPGSVSGALARPGIAEYAVVNTGEGIDVAFAEVEYDVGAYVRALRGSGLPQPQTAGPGS